MTIEKRLTGGHPNSLGNTVEVVEDILENPALLEELFECYFSDDEVVRLRVSNALKRIGKADKTLLIPYIKRLINEISKIDQASTKWTLAQLFLLLQKELSTDQRISAISIMKYNLAHHNDWIVLNQTMDTLGKWAKHDENLKHWLEPHLKRLSSDQRKSVKNKANKVIQTLHLR